MRITVITPVFPTVSTPHRGIYIYNIVRSLQRHANIDVVCSSIIYPSQGIGNLNRPNDHLAFANSSSRDVHVWRINYLGFPIVTRPLNSFSCRFAIEPSVRRLEPDVILAFWAHPEGHASLKIGTRLNVPVIVGALGSDLLLSVGIQKYLTKRAVAGADRVLTVSEDMRSVAISMGAAAENVRAIPNGCDRSIFYPRDRVACRAKLGINPHVRLVLFVGWLTRLKGIPELVVAFSEVRRKYPNAELVCIGKGPLEGMLKISARDNSNGIRAVGAKTSIEIADWLGACDLLCLPSRSEGCPNAVVEALASGRPVVATRVGGIPELVDDRSGILVPFGNSSELSTAICAGLQRSWDEHAIASRMTRSWDEVADETYSVCLEALAERKRVLRESSAVAAG